MLLARLKASMRHDATTNTALFRLSSTSDCRAVRSSDGHGVRALTWASDCFLCAVHGVLAAGDAPPNPNLADGDASNTFTEGVVLERTPYFLNVVVKVLPDGLASASAAAAAGAGLVMRSSTSLFRLDQFVSGVSYDRQFQALRAATAPDAGFVCPAMRALIVVSDRVQTLQRTWSC